MITYDSLYTLYVQMVWSPCGCCHGCRAKIAFRRDPSLIGQVLSRWHATGTYPQSPSWLEVIPHDVSSRWVTEIQAGLEAATAYIPEMPMESDRG
jgi:hypothetical protein